MSADANAIPLKKSRSDLSRTGRPIAIDMAPPQVRSAAIADSLTLGHARIEHDGNPAITIRCITYRRVDIKNIDGGARPGARSPNRRSHRRPLRQPR